MNLTEEQQATRKRIVGRCALYWVWAIITPTVVMVVLDAFDKHTPNNIVMFSLFFMMVPYLFYNVYLSRELGLVLAGESADES